MCTPTYLPVIHSLLAAASNTRLRLGAVLQHASLRSSHGSRQGAIRTGHVSNFLAGSAPRLASRLTRFSAMRLRLGAMRHDVLRRSSTNLHASASSRLPRPHIAASQPARTDGHGIPITYRTSPTGALRAPSILNLQSSISNFGFSAEKTKNVQLGPTRPACWP